MSNTAATLLDEALIGWSYAREGFTAEARGIPLESWEYRPFPHTRSVRELVVHILQAGQMAVGELTHPEGDFKRQSVGEHMAEHAGGIPVDGSPEELLDLLSGTLADGLTRFRGVGEIHMLQQIRQFDGSFATRLSWFHHSVAHEEYHRAQLAVYARGLGLVPALTKLIYGDDAS